MTTTTKIKPQSMADVSNLVSSRQLPPSSTDAAIVLQPDGLSKSMVTFTTTTTSDAISVDSSTSGFDSDTNNNKYKSFEDAPEDDFDEESFLEAANNEKFDEDMEEDPKEYHFGGYHPVNISDIYQNKYKVIRKLGWGHFATVWLVAIVDPVTKNLDPNSAYSYAALKIIKSESRYAEAALDEIKILQHVNNGSEDHPGKKHVVKLLDHFILRGPNGHHVCMVLELLGENILCLTQKFRNLFDEYKKMCENESEQKEDQEESKKNSPKSKEAEQDGISPSTTNIGKPQSQANSNKTLRLKLSDSMSFGDALNNLFTLDKVFKDYHGGLPMSLVKRITKQVLLAVDYLHRDRGLIHTDFKPENILIEIKNVDRVVDFVHREERKRSSVSRTTTSTSMASIESSSATPIPTKNASGENIEILERCQTFNNFKPSSTPPPPAPVRSNTRLSINIPTTPVRGSKPLPSPIVRKSSIWSCCYGDSCNDSSSNKNTHNNSSNNTRKSSVTSSEQSNCFDVGYERARSSISTTSNSINNSEPDNPCKTNNSNNEINPMVNNVQFGSGEYYPNRKKSQLSEQLSFLKLKDVNFDKPVKAEEKEEKETEKNNNNDKEENSKNENNNQDLDNDDLEELDQFISVKVADLGNACYYDKHFSDFIQTREYRSPEVILKTEWGCSADIWSLGCIVFELITGDYLFKPRVKNMPKKYKFDAQRLKDIDHLSKIIGALVDYKYFKNKIDCYDYYDKYFFDENEQELFEVDISKLPESPPVNFDLVKMQNVDENTYNYTKGNKFGPFLIPINMYSKSRYAKKLFDDSLRNLVFSYQQYNEKEDKLEPKQTENKERITAVAPYKIHFEPLYDIFLEEYHLVAQEAYEICDFLLRMLEINPRYREDAGSLSNHEWLDLDEEMTVNGEIEEVKIDRKIGMNGQDILGWFYEYEPRTSSRFAI